MRLQPGRIREREGAEHQGRHDDARDEPENQNCLFHRLILLMSFQIPGVNIAAAAWSVVILSGELALSESESFFRMREFGVRRLVGALVCWRLVTSTVATSRDMESGDKSPHSKVKSKYYGISPNS